MKHLHKTIFIALVGFALLILARGWIKFIQLDPPEKADKQETKK